MSFEQLARRPVEHRHQRVGQLAVADVAQAPAAGQQRREPDVDAVGQRAGRQRVDPGKEARWRSACDTGPQPINPSPLSRTAARRSAMLALDIFRCAPPARWSARSPREPPFAAMIDAVARRDRNGLRSARRSGRQRWLRPRRCAIGASRTAIRTPAAWSLCVGNRQPFAVVQALAEQPRHAGHRR